MKKCKKCNNFQEINEFARNGKYTHSYCRQCRNRISREWYKNNPTKIKERYKKREEWHKIYCRKYNKLETTKEYRRKYKSEKFKNDPLYRLQHVLRGRMHSALKTKGQRKFYKSFDLLGCSCVELKKHLESQWKGGMNWDNYGKGQGKWNIDHIIPCDSFDFSQEKEQKKCFHYTNLQPMWEIDNIRKSNKILK